jgi:hypothetical protein
VDFRDDYVCWGGYVSGGSRHVIDDKKQEQNLLCRHPSEPVVF